MCFGSAEPSAASIPKHAGHVGVKALLTQDEQEQLKVTATGLKTFERQETKVSSMSYAIPFKL